MQRLLLLTLPIVLPLASNAPSVLALRLRVPPLAAAAPAPLEREEASPRAALPSASAAAAAQAAAASEAAVAEAQRLRGVIRENAKAMATLSAQVEQLAHGWVLRH